jgi:putative transposase
MAGKGRFMDNIIIVIERLWKSLKYECVYLQEFTNGLEVKEAIGKLDRFGLHPENWIV